MSLSVVIPVDRQPRLKSNTDPNPPIMHEHTHTHDHMMDIMLVQMNAYTSHDVTPHDDK